MKDELKIDSVFLSFGDKKILNGIYLNIESNQVIGILGRNGCGKSCFLKILTGQIKAQYKHIAYNGQQLKHLYKQKGLINYLAQHRCHPKSIRVGDLLNYYDIPIVPFLEHYPFLEDQIHKKLGTLSGGQRRLIEVLLVLESKAKYSILDEPFSHIMPIHVDLVKNAIQRIKRRKAILITDHQYRSVLEVSDKAYLLKDGQLYEVKEENFLSEQGYIL